jgi:hypothetical protein
VVTGRVSQPVWDNDRDDALRREFSEMLGAALIDSRVRHSGLESAGRSCPGRLHQEADGGKFETSRRPVLNQSVEE